MKYQCGACGFDNSMRKTLCDGCFDRLLQPIKVEVIESLECPHCFYPYSSWEIKLKYCPACYIRWDATKISVVKKKKKKRRVYNPTYTIASGVATTGTAVTTGVLYWDTADVSGTATAATA